MLDLEDIPYQIISLYDYLAYSIPVRINIGKHITQQLGRASSQYSNLKYFEAMKIEKCAAHLNKEIGGVSRLRHSIRLLMHYLKLKKTPLPSVPNP